MKELKWQHYALPIKYRRGNGKKLKEGKNVGKTKTNTTPTTPPTKAKRFNTFSLSELEKTLQEPSLVSCLWPEGKNLLSKWETFVNHSETLQERHDYDTSFPLVKEIFGASIASLDDIVKEKKKPPPRLKNLKIVEVTAIFRVEI